MRRNLMRIILDYLRCTILVRDIFPQCPRSVSEMMVQLHLRLHAVHLLFAFCKVIRGERKRISLPLSLRLFISKASVVPRKSWQLFIYRFTRVVMEGTLWIMKNILPNCVCSKLYRRYWLKGKRVKSCDIQIALLVYEKFLFYKCNC